MKRFLTALNLVPPVRYLEDQKADLNESTKTKSSCEFKMFPIHRAITGAAKIIGVCALPWLITDVSIAQVSLSASKVYNVVGEYSLSYFRSNTDLSIIGQTGSNYWDFSEPQTMQDVVARMDVVPTTDSGDATDFPGATFAWRYAGGAIQGTSWEYYDLDPTNGLVLYGTYYPLGGDLIPAVPFTPPTSILPPSVAYGDSWSITYEFDEQDPLFGDILEMYEASVVVDAYGTLKLPGLNPVPSLRIAENETYYEYDPIFETWDLFQQDTNWLWFAPGVGFAAQAVSYAPNAFSPSAQPFTNSLSRVFSNPVNSPSPKVNISLSDSVVNLTWGTLSNLSGYLVEMSTNLSGGTWLPTVQTTSNIWREPALNVQGVFYRVRAQP